MFKVCKAVVGIVNGRCQILAVTRIVGRTNISVKRKEDLLVTRSFTKLMKNKSSIVHT